MKTWLEQGLEADKLALLGKLGLPALNQDVPDAQPGRFHGSTRALQGHALGDPFQHSTNAQPGRSQGSTSALQGFSQGTPKAQPGRSPSSTKELPWHNQSAPNAQPGGSQSSTKALPEFSQGDPFPHSNGAQPRRSQVRGLNQGAPKAQPGRSQGSTNAFQPLFLQTYVLKALQEHPHVNLRNPRFFRSGSKHSQQPPTRRAIGARAHKTFQHALQNQTQKMGQGALQVTPLQVTPF